MAVPLDCGPLATLFFVSVARAVWKAATLGPGLEARGTPSPTLAEAPVGDRAGDDKYDLVGALKTLSMGVVAECSC